MHDLQPATRRLVVLVERVDNTRLDAPTPCPDYRVGDLLDHVSMLTVAFTAAARKEQGTNASPPPTGSSEHLVTDWRARIAADAEALAEAWATEGAWEGTTTIAGVEMPASVVGAVGLNEVVTHSWDLARAIGQPYDVEHECIAACMEFVGPLAQPEAEARRAPAFGPVVATRADATPLDHLIALTGRDPGWTAH